MHVLTFSVLVDVINSMHKFHTINFSCLVIYSLAYFITFFLTHSLTHTIFTNIYLIYRQLPKRSDPGMPITSNNKYDLLFGVTTSEALWRFAEKDVQAGFEGERRDRIIRTYVRNAYTYHLTEIFYTVNISL